MKASFPRLARKGEVLAKSRLPDLTVDIIARILRHLPPHSLLILSETCYIMRRMSRLILEERDPLDQREYLLYLMSQSHGTLDKWVCWRCMKLHDLGIPSMWSTEPSSISRASQCSLDWLHAFQRDYHVGCRNYALSHQNVQFALKFTRMGSPSTNQSLLTRFLRYVRPRHRSNSKQWQDHFSQIMAAHYATIFTNPMCPLYMAEYDAIPRISGGSFLLYCRWLYQLSPRERHDRLGNKMLGYIKICPHQGHFYGLTNSKRREKRDLALIKHDMTPEEQVLYDVSSAWLWLDRESQIRHVNQLPRLLHEARRERFQGMEISGSCTMCRTDFTVQSLPDGDIMIRAWQDLGSENSPIDGIWPFLMMGCEGWESGDHKVL
jgi:hypothetical protein